MQAHATPATNTAMYPCGALPGSASTVGEAAAATLASPNGAPLLQLAFPQSGLLLEGLLLEGMLST